MKYATKEQMDYIHIHDLTNEKKLTRQYAWIIISSHKRKIDPGKIEPLKSFNESPASPKLKRFLLSKKEEFRQDILRTEAVEMIENLGFFVNNDDSIEIN